MREIIWATFMIMSAIYMANSKDSFRNVIAGLIFAVLSLIALII